MILDNTHAALGAHFRNEAERQVPAHYGDVDAEVLTLRKSAGWVDRSVRGRIRLTGTDRASFLQGLFTNDVVNVAPGRGVYGTFLTQKGRMIADGRVYPDATNLLLDVEPATRERILSHLDRFHFTEAVEWTDITLDTVCLSVFGPRSRTVFELLFPERKYPADLELFQSPLFGEPAWIAGNALIGDPGFDLIVPAGIAGAVIERLGLLGAKPVGWDALEIARIEAGTPRFGIELTETTIPLEAGLSERAISFKKGCYIGQEIIARIDSRGMPARRLVGFSIEGPVLPAEAEIRKGEQTVGTVMSSVVSPSLRGRPIALGYVRKDIANEDIDLVANGQRIWIVPLPFYPPRH
jgi:folate-binding protein YgfZ